MRCTSLRSSGYRLRAAFVGVLVLLVGLAGCGRRSQPVRPVASAAPAVVPAPEGLLAELFVREPGVSYAALRKLGGAPLQRLPASFELGLGLVFDWPVGAVNALAPGRPAVGVFVRSKQGRPEFVLGFALKSGRGLVKELTAPGSPLRAEVDRGSGITLLRGTQSSALGVLDEWLLAATSEQALQAAGAYVARGLARRAVPPEPFVVEAKQQGLVGIRALTAERWSALRGELSRSASQTQQAQGRPADFGDPLAVLALGDGAVQTFGDTLASCERARFTLLAEADRLELAVELVPSDGGLAARSTAELSVGSLDALLALPGTVDVAVLTRVGESELGSGAADPAGALREILGSRLPAADTKAVTDAFAHFQRGRGSTAVYGITQSAGLLVEQQVRDRAAMAAGLEGLFGLLRLPALKDPLSQRFGEIVAKASVRRVAGVEGSVEHVQIAAPKGKGREGLEALWVVRDDHATLSVARQASEGLLAAEAGPPSQSLGASPTLQAMAARRSPASFALYWDAAPPGTPAVPALVTFGKRETSARLEAELSGAAVAVLAALLGAP